MTIRDLFNNSKGIAALLVRNGSTVLTLNGGGRGSAQRSVVSRNRGCDRRTAKGRLRR